ncbi:hypothetical protein VAEKB19_380001 [Vibrio aestuarianus]|nr:hypothetical protein VAEKB19_380001 [Vibrio aestuarianus]
MREWLLKEYDSYQEVFLREKDCINSFLFCELSEIVDFYVDSLECCTINWWQ